MADKLRCISCLINKWVFHGLLIGYFMIEKKKTVVTSLLKNTNNS